MVAHHIPRPLSAYAFCGVPVAEPGSDTEAVPQCAACERERAKARRVYGGKLPSVQRAKAAV
jgi:hypothetical protein